MECYDLINTSLTQETPIAVIQQYNDPMKNQAFRKQENKDLI